MEIALGTQKSSLCSKWSRKIERDVLKVWLNRYSHLLQPINNIFNATVQIACDKRFFARLERYWTFGASIWVILCWMFLVFQGNRFRFSVYRLSKAVFIWVSSFHSIVLKIEKVNTKVTNRECLHGNTIVLFNPPFHRNDVRTIYRNLRHIVLWWICLLLHLIFCVNVDQILETGIFDVLKFFASRQRIELQIEQLFRRN
jgi:hypothetical protein